MPVTSVDDLYVILDKRDSGEPEFRQAVTEVIESLKPVFERDPKFLSVFEAMMEPERVIIFRVPWMDDKGRLCVNRGYRVQFNSAIGPYKGGLRFHPSVNLSILKFLGFEQILKNSLTTLPMGGGKGGSDFDPKGKSEGEVMRFCQSFMTELSRHIGPNTDVPAGDIGVGRREIGYMFGQYKRIKDSFEGVLTGKHTTWGGSLIRPEATGYGVTYYLQHMIEDHNDKIEGKTILISGSGNVAQFAVQKCIQLGAKVISMSDSNGTVMDYDGINEEKLAYVMDLKNVRRGRMAEYVKKYPSAKYFADKKPWQVFEGNVDVCMPCATQNEVDDKDAERLCTQGKLKYICEAANMPTTPAGIEVFFKHNVPYGPSKAANAGGVAVSGLEMSQNSMRLSWTSEKVDKMLHRIMGDIFAACRDTAKEFGKPGNYMMGANIAAFKKVATAMLDQGYV